MANITLPNGRTDSDIRMHVSLRDVEMLVDWAGVQNIRAYMYSDEQKAIAGRCDIHAIAGTDLVVDYPATRPQYPGVNRVIVRCVYSGRQKTYDKPAINLVPRTDDLAGAQVVLDDPEVTVEINVEEVSTSLLDEAISAAVKAAAAAQGIADVHVGPAAGFGIIDAEADDNVGTPEVEVTTSGDDQEKNIHFNFKNFKGRPGERGPVGVERVIINIDDQTGTPSAECSVEDGVMLISMHCIKGQPGAQGNPGSSQDYPFELVNNRTTDDATKAATAAVAKGLGDDIYTLENALGAGVTYEETQVTSSPWADGSISKTDGSVITTDAYQYTTIPVGEARYVRFMGNAYKTPANWNGGYAFYDANDDCIAAFAYGSASENTPKEYIVPVPAGAVTFKTAVYVGSSDYDVVKPSNWYCYLRFGYSASELINVLDKQVHDNEQEIKQDLYREFVDADNEHFYGKLSVSSSGALSSNTGAKLYRYAVKKGDVLIASTNASVSYAAIAFSTDAEPSAVTMVMMQTGAYNYFTYQAPADGYVFVGCLLNNSAKVLLIRQETPLEIYGVSKFTFGRNVLQRFVGTDVTDTDIWGAGYLTSTGGVASASNYHYTKEFIPILPGSYISRINFSSNAKIVYYDKDKEVLGYLSSGNATESRSRTFPAGAAYVRISLNGSTTDFLSLVFQDEGAVVAHVPEVDALEAATEELDARVATIESNAAGIRNNLVNEFSKCKGWRVRTEQGGSFADLTEEYYGAPSVQYAIPISSDARALHIKFKFKLANGKLQYNGGSLNQPMLTVKGSSSYMAALRQQASLYNTDSALITRRQFFVVQQGNNVNNVTLGDQEKDCLWGEPTYLLWYKGEDYANVYTNTINITSSGIVIKDQEDNVLETIAVEEDELIESVINKINTSSEFLSAKAYEVAGVKYSDTLQINSVPLCLSTQAKLYLIPSLLDTRWHDIEAVIDYDKLMSWTNIDGYTVKRDITDIEGGYLYLGGQVDSTIGMAPYQFKDLEVSYGYDDAEIITYPNNVEGTLERLISNDSPYLMIFEGHGEEDKTNTQGTTNNMDVTTDRLRTVFEYLRSKGFVPVNWQQVKDWRLTGAKLPKRCFTLMFDDFRIENYMNNKLREPFVQFGVKPGLAIITGSDGQTRSRSEEVTIDGVTWTLGECFDAIVKGGWYPCSHTKGHNLINNISYIDLLPTLKDWIYSCDKLGIYDDILVYPQGLASDARRALFPVSGFALGVAVSVNGYNCRIRSQYKLIRNEIGQRRSLENVLAQIV